MTGNLEYNEDRYEGNGGLHCHHQELGHDVGGNDLHREDPRDPGPLQQALGPLRDE